LTLAYLGVTIIAFVAGPFDWPVDNWTTLLCFLAAVTLAMYGGFRLALTRPAVGAPFDGWRLVIVLGAIANVVILFPAAYAYTGKMPWDVFSALRDQQAAYEELQQTLLLTADTRTPVVLARTLAAPLTFAVVPLGLLHWGRMSIQLRILFVVSIGSTLAFSILRGTDREIADLVLISGAATMIKLARLIVHEKIRLSDIVRRYALGIIFAGLAFLAAATLFIDRKEGRVTDIHYFCFDETTICADFDHPILRAFGERGQFALVMAAAYASNGYYGLSLALGLNFHSTFGLGHAPFLMKAYSDLVGSDALYEQSYTYRLRELGWDDLRVWSTMFPWIANDIGFLMMPVLMLVIGWIFGGTWRDAVLAREDRAAIVFAFMTIMIAYIPANSQLTLVSDSYFSFVVWIAWWLLGRRRSRSSNSYTELGACTAADQGR
jgi:hypothetical protein